LKKFPGLMVGVTPFICNSRYEKPIHEVVRKIPLDRLLVNFSNKSLAVGNLKMVLL
jgi:Tat protein secretion system quality control protein TatD with DNase activity